MCLPVTPFKVEREWQHAGLQCAVVLSREAGHRCGYVRVPPSHPAHGKDYDAVDVEAHGCLTFSEIESCTDHGDGKGCWFGFDTAHLGDARYDPTMRPEDCTTDEGRRSLEIEREMSEQFPMPHHSNDHYWSQAEVELETEVLAEQLASIACHHASEQR